MLAFLKSLWSDEEGQGMTEYALILALVAVAIIAVVIAFRDQIAAVFTNAAGTLQQAQQPPQ
jgi:pilus assembly protein Flp/PilA